MTVEYFLGDHLGSTSITTDANGAKVSEIRYKPWGEIRYAWTSNPSTTPAYTLPTYTYTGQYSYLDDPSTSGVTEGFGLMFYNARWMDPALGRFVQADTIVPPGVQGLDRYAYVNNSPINYVDPNGHVCSDPDDPTPSCDGSGGYPSNVTPLPQNSGSSNLLIFQAEGNMQWTDAETAGFNQYAEDVAQSYANVANAFLHVQCMATANPYNEPCDSISPTEAFLEIHDGPVTVIRKSQTCAEALGGIPAYAGCGGWGFAASPNEIWIFSNATPNDIATHPQLIVHELGHSFSQAGNAKGFDWVYTGLSINRNGFYGPALSWQLSTDMSPSEIYADMFLGWVYGKWEHDARRGRYTADGQQKAKFMYGTNTYVLKLLGLHP